MTLEVLEHDKLLALVALLCAAAAIVLVLRQVSHLYVGGAPLTKRGPLGASVRLKHLLQNSLQVLHIDLTL